MLNFFTLINYFNRKILFKKYYSRILFQKYYIKILYQNIISRILYQHIYYIKNIILINGCNIDTRKWETEFKRKSM